jgi:hypothetical protein
MEQVPMLAVQCADCMLYLPEHEVASLTPVYPERWRVVTSDGRVGHVPRLVETRYWVALGSSLVNPAWLVREGKFWLDPAGFGYAYQPLPQPEAAAEVASSVQWLYWMAGARNRVFWVTDEGEVACEDGFLQALAKNPDLIRIDSRTAIHRLRLRKIEHGRGKRKIHLDNGKQLWVMPGYMAPFCRALGIDSPSEIDLKVPSILYELREYPYDLTKAGRERLRGDFSGARTLMLGLIWQTVLQGAEATADLGSFYQRPIRTTLRRAGWSIGQEALRATLDYLIVNNGLFRYRQLGYYEPLPERRRLGSRKPEVIVLGDSRAGELADRLGLSFFDPGLYMGVRWEYFVELLGAAGVKSVRLLACQVLPVHTKAILLHLKRLGMQVLGPVLEVEPELESLSQGLAREPKPPEEPRPTEALELQRVVVETQDGLVFFHWNEVAAITPTPPNRWRYVDQIGRVGYRPDLVTGPLLALGHSWVRPELLQGSATEWVDPAGFPHAGALSQAQAPRFEPPDEVVALQRKKAAAVWVRLDGRETPAGCPIELARAQHAGLVRVTDDCYINRQHLLSIGKRYQLHLAGGMRRNPGTAHHARLLAAELGLPNLWSLDTREELFHYSFRDYAFELAAASGERLRGEFKKAIQLISAIVWQNFCFRKAGLDSGYGDSFSGFFYMPLQPALHRAGFLSNREFKAPLQNRPCSNKDRLYADFCDLVWSCVYRYKLFSYQEFGFVDPRPEKRLVGTQRPEVILLVEKGDLIEDFAVRLHHELGLSVLILGGSPKLIDVEYFARALRQVHGGEIRVLAYVDHDWPGSLIGPAFVEQMAFMGFACTQLQMVVSPDCFEAEELERYSLPVSACDPGQLTVVDKWMAQGGGIGGEQRSIQANCLVPYQRVRARVEQLL